MLSPPRQIHLPFFVQRDHSWSRWGEPPSKKAFVGLTASGGFSAMSNAGGVTNEDENQSERLGFPGTSFVYVSPRPPKAGRFDCAQDDGFLNGYFPLKISYSAARARSPPMFPK